MVETHYDPDNAWSDAKQQITPEKLHEITKELIVRAETSPEINYTNKMNTLRTQIDLLIKHF